MGFVLVNSHFPSCKQRYLLLFSFFFFLFSFLCCGIYLFIWFIGVCIGRIQQSLQLLLQYSLELMMQLFWGGTVKGSMFLLKNTRRISKKWFCIWRSSFYLTLLLLLLLLLLLFWNSFVGFIYWLAIISTKICLPFILLYLKSSIVDFFF